MNVGMIIAAVVAVLLLWVILSNNKFVRQKMDVKEALSGIDVALQKRYDLLTNEVAIVKGYAEHEYRTFAAVAQYRASMTVPEKGQWNDQVTSELEKVTMIAEQYPKIKSNRNFAKLQDTVIDVEEHLQAARRVYNTCVAALNKRVKMFPSCIIALIRGIEEEHFFEETESTDVSVKLY